jgi:hypothetical protein
MHDQLLANLAFLMLAGFVGLVVISKVLAALPAESGSRGWTSTPSRWTRPYQKESAPPWPT